MKFSLEQNKISSPEQENESRQLEASLGDKVLINKDKFLKIPLSKEELEMPIPRLAEKYGFTYSGAKFVKENGYRSVKNPEHITEKSRQEQIKSKVFEYLEEVGVLVSRDPLVFDFEKMNKISSSEFYKKRVYEKNSSHGLNYSDFIENLRIEKCFSKKELEHSKENNTSIEPKYFFDIPEKKDDLLNNPNKKTGYIDIWNFGEKTNWGHKITLGDKTETSVAEIFTAKKLKELGAHRNSEGRLVVTDPLEKKEKPFTGKLIKKLYGLQIHARMKTEKEALVTSLGGVAFAEHFLPNLLASGIIKSDDFRVVGNTAENLIYGASKKKLDPNKPYVSFTNKFVSARYYIGRENIVGTKTPINENMYMVQLDENLMGIIEDIPGKKSRLLYTINGLNESEANEGVKKITEDFEKKGKESIGKPDITNFFTVGADTMKNKIKEYKVTALFPIRQGESTEDYAERIAKLGDTNYVIENFRKFFTRANIGVHNLPWKDQLAIANAILEQKDDRKLLDFASKFGLKGIRTFLSIEQGGKEMEDKILTLGEKLFKENKKELADKIFEKYGEMIDIADNAKEEVEKIFGSREIPNKVLISVKETLLKRGAKLLSDLSDRVMEKDFKISEQEVFNELEEIKGETILLGKSYVSLYKEGIVVPIEDITETEEISTENLSEDQKKELVKVYMNGRPKVTYENKEHLDLLVKEFEEELNNKNISVFNIRFNGDIIIFAVVDKKDKDTLYIGGLTFVNEIRNPIIADAAMGHVLEKFKNYNIKALVDSKNPILAMYQKRFGFNIVRELPREENAGELYYEIERPKDTDRGYKIEKEQQLKKVA